MPALARRLTLVLVACGLVAAAPAAHAATTTYSTATSLSSIAVGDTAVLVNGGSLTAGSLTNSGTLQFDLSNDLTVTTQLNGNGAFVKTNSGTVTLDQPNGYTGPTYIAAGTILTGFNAGDQGLGNTQQLFFTGTSGMLKYGDNSTQFASGITLAGTGALANSLTTMNVTGKITGTGVLNLFSSGSAAFPTNNVTINSPLTLAPSVPSDFVGTINVLQGLVTPSNSNNPFGDASNVIVLDGGGLAWPNAASTSTTVSNPIRLAAGGGQVAARASGGAGFLILNSVISGTGSLTRLGGTVNLFGANTFTGDTYLGTTSAGSLQLGNVDALANSTIDRPTTDQSGRLQYTGTVSSGTAFVNIGGIKGSASLGGSSGDTVNLSFGGNNQSTTFTGTLGWLDVEQLGYYNTFQKAGTGTLTLTADNRAKNGVVLANGVLAVNSDRALGVGTGLDTNNDPSPAVNTQPVVMTGGTLQLTTLFTMPRAITLQTGGGGLDTSLLSGTSVPNFPGNITGTAGLSIRANGATTGTSVGSTVLTGTNTYVGTTTILAGVVTATSNFGSVSNTVALSGGGLLAAGGARTNAYAVSLGAAHGWLRAAAAGDTLNQAATISGSGNLLSSGSGIVNLTVANTNTGDVRIVEGTLNAANVNALQNATLDMNAADIGTIGFTVAGNTTYVIGGLKGSRNIDNTGDTLSVGGNNQSTTYSGDISGAGGFTKVGSGALTLDGTNSYSGGTTVSAGSLIGNSDSLQGAITNNATIQFAQAATGTYAGSMTGSGSVTKTGAGALTLSGTNNHSGGTTVSAGRLIGTASSLQGAIANNAVVEFAQASAGTYSGAMTGSGSVTKSSAGTLTMSGSSSYSGPTSVSAGSMLVTGTIAISAVTVDSGALLGGNGLVGALTTISSGGTLSPGATAGSFGSLSLGSLSLGSTATTVLAITGTSPGVNADQVSILGAGSLAYGGTLDLAASNINGAAVGTSYTLFDFASTPTGNFSSLTALGGDYSGITWTGPVGGVWTSTTGPGVNYLTFTEGTGTLAVVPEPTSLALAALGGLGCWIAACRRRG